MERPQRDAPVGRNLPRKEWANEQLVQISESMTGRAIRTPDWTYCVADMTGARKKEAKTYTEYQMYGLTNELVNLAGRQEFRKQADALRERLKRLMAYAGESEPEIKPAPLYP